MSGPLLASPRQGAGAAWAQQAGRIAKFVAVLTGIFLLNGATGATVERVRASSAPPIPLEAGDPSVVTPGGTHWPKAFVARVEAVPTDESLSHEGEFVYDYREDRTWATIRFDVEDDEGRGEVGGLAESMQVWLGGDLKKYHVMDPKANTCVRFDLCDNATAAVGVERPDWMRATGVARHVGLELLDGKAVNHWATAWGDGGDNTLVFEQWFTADARHFPVRVTTRGQAEKTEIRFSNMEYRQDASKFESLTTEDCADLGFDAVKRWFSTNGCVSPAYARATFQAEAHALLAEYIRHPARFSNIDSALGGMTASKDKSGASRNAAAAITGAIAAQNELQQTTAGGGGISDKVGPDGNTQMSGVPVAAGGSGVSYGALGTRGDTAVQRPPKVQLDVKLAQAKARSEERSRVAAATVGNESGATGEVRQGGKDEKGKGGNGTPSDGSDDYSYSYYTEDEDGSDDDDNARRQPPASGAPAVPNSRLPSAAAFAPPPQRSRSVGSTGLVQKTPGQATPPGLVAPQTGVVDNSGANAGQDIHGVSTSRTGEKGPVTGESTSSLLRPLLVPRRRMRSSSGATLEELLDTARRNASASSQTNSSERPSLFGDIGRVQAGVGGKGDGVDEESEASYDTYSESGAEESDASSSEDGGSGGAAPPPPPSSI